MLKKCTVNIFVTPSKLLLTQKAFTRPLAYRFALSTDNKNKNSSVGKQNIEAELFNLKNLSFSTYTFVQKDQQRKSQTQNQETSSELSLQQKLYFAQVAGFLLLGNILLRLSLDSKKPTDPYDKKS